MGELGTGPRLERKFIVVVLAQHVVDQVGDLVQSAIEDDLQGVQVEILRRMVTR